jgi:hypothetical protein
MPATDRTPISLPPSDRVNGASKEALNVFRPTA